MSRRQRRLGKLHSPWWTAVATIAGVLSLIVALFAWQLPQAPGGSEPKLAGSSSEPRVTTITTTPTTSSTVSTSEPRPTEELLLYHEGEKVDRPIKAMPGARLQMQVLYTNLSRKIQPNVTLLVKSPWQIEVIRGILLRTSSNGDGQWLDADLTGPAVDIGGYLPEGNAIVGFFFRVGDEDSFNCGTSTLVPQVFLASGGETVSAELTIRVSKSC